ncbi:MAG: DNA polymerase III subunit gamma/tau [Proteobacteria bacterium]|nr:DNA polymerase III subunit gamma/tau [Pseudomonadota bacterium]
MNKSNEYLVLARKYRSKSFVDLVGQDILVQTLENAIKSNRIHHAYVLSGIRGCGKTSTARILAKALNCENGPSINWEENDSQAKAIEIGNHVDVLEFDAASHTGVDDIKELFDGVHYKPVQGRYKVYIIDEVHMLSKHAFNALLKTLEEPPSHVKFIFATTEVNKIPVTVLSRCQRFDLKRISSEDLFTHFVNILKQEKVKFEDEAINVIAKAADGSARDGLSLLDQAIALSKDNMIDYNLVADMIGFSDKTVVFDLLEKLVGQDIESVLEIAQQIHHDGKDVNKFVEDILESINLLSKLKLVSKLKNSKYLSEIEKERAIPLSEKLSISVLSRIYQMFLKIYQELKVSPNMLQSFEMGLIRVYHLSQVPDTEALLKMLADHKSASVKNIKAKPVKAAKKEDVKPKEVKKAAPPTTDEVMPPPFVVPEESSAKK